VVTAPKPIKVSWLPSGHGLPLGVWRQRQRGIVILLVLHAVGLFVFALVRGNSLLHSFTEAGIIEADGLPAGGSRDSSN